MATFPLATLAATVTSTGISAPTYAEIYQSLQASFQSIYGTDSYIDPDSQDGQLLAIVAKAIADCNDASVAVYNSYSPATAFGAGLSNAVKINGIARAVPTNSTVLVRVSGQVGATIINGMVGGPGANRWLLPASVTIPSAGFIDVTATAENAGAINADIGDVNQILTPTLGWQSVTNTANAAPGAAVETDAALRQRQTVSVALPSRTVLAGIVGAVQAIDGVTQVVALENDTDATDANGLPEHSIALIVLGGDSTAIAEAILSKKTPGCYTYGTTAIPVTDTTGITYTIRFFIPTDVDIGVGLTIKALPGYTSAIGTRIKQSVADFINALSIGSNVDIGRIFLPAQFFGGSGSETFELNSVLLSRLPASPSASDVVLDFDERPLCSVDDISLTVT